MPYFSVVQLDPKTDEVRATVEGFHPDFSLAIMRAQAKDGREIITAHEYEMRVEAAALAAKGKV